MHIYDAAGRMVKTLKPEAAIFELGTDLVPGLYFLKPMAGEHEETKKLIKIR